ncbi:class I SAM-dependent DNA methyltransferase [Geobacter argillaceus]|uniref:site-specific DNA-methyltransferase (adenine-specific) n=1 Tax=Geobacter argillaceus TaxID=345631 RepID=A0A562WQP2_9BACT|nr:Eco57I restriction-modification methylase domain-containing protein [Geobacter argillaceus]TWJ32476.1 TaqI restriction endonuclease [Geobacter argillaceus]
MKLQLLSPAKALNKAYLRQSLKRDQIELFKANLARMFERLRSDEHEEHLKNIVADFLKDTWYKPGFEINTSKRADLVIHNGKSSDDSIGVIIETKKPSNRAEMISPERPNAKALHELLHYYMQERYIKGNQEIKRLIVCNIYEWYIFDAADFERFFFGNQRLVKSYKDWNDGLLVSTNTDWFYQEIAKPFIEKELTELPCTCFDLRDFEKIARNPDKVDDRKLINLFKLLSPAHLLKQPFTNDSNSLNREFYNELLHIIGLEEVKEKGKKLIGRKPEGSRLDGSLLENTVSYLKNRNRLAGIGRPEQYGGSEDEQLFSIALELCITWLNRLLFLKLLEGQLIGYHRGDQAHAFLNSRRIADYDDLDELFFDVLAVRPADRTESVRKKFGSIPYLNSSLFEESELERATMRINELKNRHDLPLYSATVLKEPTGRRRTGGMNTLHYLFEFLDAYDFAAEGAAEIQEQNKTIINASVLGLIFEKINGYRDGSFFTPGFITMYICRETVRRAVVQRFNERYGWDCADFTALYNCLDKITLQEANETVNSLKICDPAVGSGHFLVSALNEMIAVKADLEILADRDGKRLRGYSVAIENDELIVTGDDQLFSYNYRDPESQRVQEILFHEKETIIENCLFGVDINAKSVAICRLRLWIELLKNAYYRRGTLELETLPNIDINIKCGNSLVSRFAITGNPGILPGDRKKLKELTEKYRSHVFDYKLSPANKAQLRKVIEGQKEDLLKFGLPNDKDLVELRRRENFLDQLPLFTLSKKEAAERQKLTEEVEALKKRFEEKQRSLYANAFEWRFEFPEVLDGNGEFTGFDAVIGNPPYIRQEAIKEQKPAFVEMFGDFYCGTADIYTYFYKTGLGLLRNGGLLCYIAPNKFMRSGYGRNTRELLTTAATPLMVLDFGDLPVFDEATTYPSIVLVEKAPPSIPPCQGGRGKRRSKAPSLTREGVFLAATLTDPAQLQRFAETLPAVGFTMPVSALSADGWTLERPEVLGLMDKLRNAGKPLGEYVEGKFYYGIKTGLNEAFVIDEETKARLIAEDPKSAEIIKPWLRGRDIRKWKAEPSGVHIIYIPWRFDIEKYPAVLNHLLQYRDKLEQRNEALTGRHEWYALQRYASDYICEFNKKKIVYQVFQVKPLFLIDNTGVLTNNAAYIVPDADEYLLAYLNSKLGWYLIQQFCSPIQNGYQLMATYFGKSLIYPATAEQKAPIIELVQKILTDPDDPEVPRLEAEIDRLVYALYGLTGEEIALIEGAN